MKNSIKFIILIFIITFSLLVIAYNTFYIVDVKTLRMSFKVDDLMGINVSNDSLNFGRSYPGSLLKRKINLTNNYNFPVTVSIKFLGNLSEFTYVDKNNFILDSDEYTQITYLVDIPKDIKYGHYEGKTKIFFKRKI
jgi:hypothetical protein